MSGASHPLFDVDKHASDCVFSVFAVPSREAPAFLSLQPPHHMNYLATTQRLLFIALLSLATSATAFAQYTTQGVTTDAIYTQFSTNGNWGDDCTFDGHGFTQGGEETLCGGGFLLGIDVTQVLGGAYTETGDLGFNEVSAPAATASPYLDFDQGYEFSMTDNLGIGLDIDVLISAKTSGPLDATVIVDYTISNNSGGTISGMYPGIFMDWDQGSFADHTSTVDPDLNLVYVFDGTGASTIYTGQTLLSGDLAGWDHFSDYDEQPIGPVQDHAAVFASLSTMDVLTVTASAGGDPPDIRLITGAGPITLADGESALVSWALHACVDFAAITGASAFVREVWDAVHTVAIEPGPDGLPGTHNLSAVYPNPFNPQANFTLEVAEQQSVRIAVYDALGREVATLFNGTLTAGTEHAFVIDGAGLPSGVYMVRATGEQFTDVRRVTLMK